MNVKLRYLVGLALLGFSLLFLGVLHGLGPKRSHGTNLSQAQANNHNDPKSIATNDDPTVGNTWPASCSKDSVPVVFPNSTQIRTTHMIGLMRRIGGCGRIVDAVMQNDVQVSKQIGKGDDVADLQTNARSEGKWLELNYEDEVIFNSSVYPNGNFPRGNRPNAATHFRMFKALSQQSPGYPDGGWAMMMEDDAQLHADLKKMLDTPKSVADMLKWSFQVATSRNDTLISYGVCKGKGSICTPINIGSFQEQYPGIQMATCTGDVRCAATYAIPKWRTHEIISAYQTLNSGSTDCPAGLMSTTDCGRDPFALVNYLGLCQQPRVVQPCTTLVVGYNFISPTSGDMNNPKHLGAFIQEKSKGGIGHIVIRHDLVDGLKQT